MSKIQMITKNSNVDWFGTTSVCPRGVKKRFKFLLRRRIEKSGA